MKIKRIFASDMRQAIRQVREEHGPDAVILSSKSVSGGVEVVSAIDFDHYSEEADTAAWSTPPPTAQGGRDRGTFGAALREADRREEASTRPGGLRVTVDDSLEADLEQSLASQIRSAAETEAPRAAPPRQRSTGARAATPSRSASVPADVEWNREPAIQEMRSELKTLRALFENQLSLLDWQQTDRRHPVRALVLRHLMELGFGPDVCRKVAERVADNVSPEVALRHALAILARHTPTAGEDLVDQGGVVAMVGPTGVGKTTTVAKLAARFALRHGRQHVALVSTDNYRIGAQDQLRNFARILGVAVHTADSAEELREVLDDLTERRLVLIDTAGMSRSDLRLAEQFRTLRVRGAEIRSYLVLSANTQLASLDESARAFRRVGLSGCIITKVDEAASLGPALTVMLRNRLPAAYLGVGQRVPEDLRPARGDRLVQQAAEMGRSHKSEVEEDQLAMAFGAGG